ncbi:hypothetical protein ACILE2_01795 [Capnocytophaga canimorsus]|uniref:hypothetical protein n=1 Tax=Capnocytophaga canimorsus TaxID=28188 RepID=UPI0037D117E6
MNYLFISLSQDFITEFIQEFIDKKMIVTTMIIGIGAWLLRLIYALVKRLIHPKWKDISPRLIYLTTNFFKPFITYIPFFISIFVLSLNFYALKTDFSPQTVAFTFVNLFLLLLYVFTHFQFKLIDVNAKVKSLQRQIDTVYDVFSMHFNQYHKKEGE